MLCCIIFPLDLLFLLSGTHLYTDLYSYKLWVHYMYVNVLHPVICFLLLFLEVRFTGGHTHLWSKISFILMNRQQILSMYYSWLIKTDAICLDKYIYSRGPKKNFVTWLKIHFLVVTTDCMCLFLSVWVISQLLLWDRCASKTVRPKTRKKYIFAKC